jgi:hypothetical protein
LISNVVGAPALAYAYPTYGCAMMTCGCNGPPSPFPFGSPLFESYEDAFGQTYLSIAPYGSPPSASLMSIVPGPPSDAGVPAANPYELIQSAMVTFPILSNPFDQSSAAANPASISELVLSWISEHTYGSANPLVDCGIQYKYSTYGNYVEDITFGINPGEPLQGIRFGFSPGYAGSVITDVTIFDPNVVATLGQ